MFLLFLSVIRRNNFVGVSRLYFCWDYTCVGVSRLYFCGVSRLYLWGIQTILTSIHDTPTLTMDFNNFSKIIDDFWAFIEIFFVLFGKCFKIKQRVWNFYIVISSVSIRRIEEKLIQSYERKKMKVIKNTHMEMKL